MNVLRLQPIGKRLATLILALFVMAGAVNAFEHPQQGGPPAAPVAMINITDLAAAIGQPSDLKCCSKADSSIGGNQTRCMADLTVLPSGIVLKSCAALPMHFEIAAAVLTDNFHHALLRPPIQA